MEDKRGARSKMLILDDYMGDKNKELVDKYLQEKWEDIIMDAAFNTSFDSSTACTAANTNITPTLLDYESMVETLNAMPKFVTKLEMSYTTRDLLFGNIETVSSETMYEQFDGVQIWIDPGMDTGTIKKIYNDGSSEMGCIFKIDTTTYGIFGLD